jgi:hypothetical protein
MASPWPLSACLIRGGWSVGREVGLFGWLVADGWCWFVLREEYCWLVAGGWFILREKYCWLVADKPNEQPVGGSGKLQEWRKVGVADWVACGYMAKADGCKRCWQLQP